MDDDLSLLDQWSAGDTEAGNTLFRRHFPALYRFFDHKTEGEIDDLVQETFLQCLKGRDTFKRQSSFRTYLFAIARHVLFYYWRKRAHTHTAIDFEDASIASLSTSIATRLAKNEDRARLLTALRALPRSRCTPRASMRAQSPAGSVLPRCWKVLLDATARD